MTKGKFHTKQRWVTNNFSAQEWVNSIVWLALQKPGSTVKLNPENEIDEVGKLLLYNTLNHHGLAGIALSMFGDVLKPILGDAFYKKIDADAKRAEILLQELYWLLVPKVGSEFIVIGDVPMQRFYRQKDGSKVQNSFNPRIVDTLQVWTPTLMVRDTISAVLKNAGYVENTKEQDGYLFQKVTFGLTHTVLLKGVLWETSQNWSTQLERDMWDRLIPKQDSGLMELDLTDTFMLMLRYYGINTLFGSGINLLDLVMILEQSARGGIENPTIDWTRLEQVKTMFRKPFWLWAPVVALELFEKRSGRKLEMPSWLRSGAQMMYDSFWDTFIESRINWSNPDLRFADFSRVFVKLSQGK